MPPIAFLSASQSNNYIKRLPFSPLVMWHNSNTHHTPHYPRQHTPIPHPHQQYHPPTNAHPIPSPPALAHHERTPGLWNLHCLNTNFVQFSPISIPEHLKRCSLLQSLYLPRGLPFSPANNQPQNNTSDTTNTLSPTLTPHIPPHISRSPLTYKPLLPFLWQPKTIHKTKQPVL